MMLRRKTTVTDLNWLLSCGDILPSSIRRSTVNEQRKNSVFANTRFYPKASIQNLCKSLQRQLSSQIFLMLRPISDDGIRTINLPRKPKRYRNLLKSFASKTLSLWLSRQSFSKQFSKCKREEGIPNISRPCTGAYQKGKAALRQRRLRHHTEKYGLCFGLNRHRPVSVAVSVGSASQVQKCGETPYTNGHKRLYTHVYTHYKRCCTRNNSFSRYTPGTFGHIRHGQGVHRFRNIIQFFKEQLLLYYQSKKEYSFLSQVFSSNRQKHRTSKRPDDKTYWPENFKTLSDTTETNHFSRRRSKPNFCFPDQQFSIRRTDNLFALQIALADRTFLQVDQTAFANKIFFRYVYQCCQDSSLDSDQCLCACRDNQKRVEAGALITRNTPNSKYLTFRENLAETSTYGKLLYY